MPPSLTAGLKINSGNKHGASPTPVASGPVACTPFCTCVLRLRGGMHIFVQTLTGLEKLAQRYATLCACCRDADLYEDIIFWVHLHKVLRIAPTLLGAFFAAACRSFVKTLAVLHSCAFFNQHRYHSGQREGVKTWKDTEKRLAWPQ